MGADDERWESYYLQLDGQLNTIAVNLDVRARAPAADLPILTRIIVPVAGSEAYFFFTPEEGEFLDLLVAGLEGLLRRGRSGIRKWLGAPPNEVLFVGRLAREGEAQLYFHSGRPIGKPTFVELERMVPGPAWSCEFTEDPAWRTYLEMLHPGVALNPLRLSWATIEEHKRQGSDLAVRRPVDHTLFFPTDEARQAFLDEVRRDSDVQVRVFETEDAGATHPFGVDLTWEHALLRGVVDPYVVGLSHRASRFGGNYDGWGSLVVGSKQG